MRHNTRTIGTRYEKVAAEYLEQKGYKILQKNYRNRYGEIDVIAQKDAVLVFIEIKFRSSDSYRDPLEAVDQRKQKRISQTALFYYAAHGYSENASCRFDVIGIYEDGTVKHIENAFEFVG